MELFGGLPESDLKGLKSNFHEFHSELENVNIVIVGASGFLGYWLATYFTYLYKNKSFKGTISLVVRNPVKMSNLSDFIDSRNFKVLSTIKIDTKDFSHLSPDVRTILIYAATSTSQSGVQNLDMLSEVTHLPNQLLDSLRNRNLTFIHLSSGGIYEPGSRLRSSIPGDFEVQLSSNDVYINEKIQIEKWVTAKANENQFIGRNPRLFAFYGPRLQLDRHFAIGNFIEKANNGKPIVVTGNPSNLRSYLYPTDAIQQILSQCHLEEPTHKQIGSRKVLNLLDVATCIANEFSVDVQVVNQNNFTIDNYIPEDVPEAQEVDFFKGVGIWKEWLERTRS